MKGDVDPKVKAARAAYEEAKRRRAEAEAALSAANAALNAASKAYEAACSMEGEAGRLLDDAIGLHVCEMGRGTNWRRVVITRRTTKSVWVRTYGWPSTSHTRFVLSRRGWRRPGDGHRMNPIGLRGVP